MICSRDSCYAPFGAAWVDAWKVLVPRNESKHLKKTEQQVRIKLDLNLQN
jgi:hypothetical protein